MSLKEQIAVINHGGGNVRSVFRALSYLSPESRINLTQDPIFIENADRVVFPGQGAVSQCMATLNEKGFSQSVVQAIKTKPFLGICLGLELLFEISEEDPKTPCLAVFKGRVVRFNPPNSTTHQQNKLKIPQIGWNQVSQLTEHPLWHKISNHSYFYSVHSYHIKETDATIATGQTTYGYPYTSAIAKGPCFAVQFHPEKSQENGLQMLKNFLSWKVS